MVYPRTNHPPPLLGYPGPTIAAMHMTPRQVSPFLIHTLVRRWPHIPVSTFRAALTNHYRTIIPAQPTKQLILFESALHLPPPTSHLPHVHLTLLLLLLPFLLPFLLPLLNRYLTRTNYCHSGRDLPRPAADSPLFSTPKPSW